MKKDITVNICENTVNGDRSGKAHQITIDVFDDICLHFEAKYFINGVPCDTDSRRVVIIHNNRFKFGVHQDWAGTMMWNSYVFPPDYGLGLINTVFRSKKWDIIEGWSSLIEKYERGELITGIDLELDQDYQPMALNPNQYDIPYFNQVK